MNPISITYSRLKLNFINSRYFFFFAIFVCGLLGPFGFSPFHIPGSLILSLSVLFSVFLRCSERESFTVGFIYGLGFFGFGVSWVIISIHDYGQISYLFSAFITILFVAYLSLFPALVGYLFNRLSLFENKFFLMALFAALWCLSEWLRAHIFTGFPWLLIGVSQMDTPIAYLGPLLGVYGLTFITVFESALLCIAMLETGKKRVLLISLFVAILIGPTLLKNIEWTHVKNTPISIGAVQANLSMRDKWDEHLFWKLLQLYERETTKLLGTQLIILPESAIPLPENYVEDYLHKLNKMAHKAHSAILLGILQPTDETESTYYNSLISLGDSEGEYQKRQLVPFGEYIPAPFVAINNFLGLPQPNIIPGAINQKLLTIFKHPIATLICYEIAYPYIVRMQLPTAEFIVSISDNGWFGHSFASYQQLQMAQMLSSITGRYQVVVNNDGLSSVINTHGQILESLAPFSAGILHGSVYPATGSTPWFYWQDYPVILACFLFLLFSRLRFLR